MSVTQLDTLVVGATFTGIGLIGELQKLKPNIQSVLIEREITLGHEFTYAYKHGTNWQHQKELNQAARILRAELTRRNVLSAEGRAHLPGITPILYQHVRDQELPIRLKTEVVSVQAAGRGYKVTLYDSSGISELIVRRIIDTSSVKLSCPQRQQTSGKRISALLHAKKNEHGLVAEQALHAFGGAAEFNAASFSFKRGRFESESYISIPLAAEDGWIEARRKIHQFWANRPVELEGWSLATVADQFDYEPNAGPHEIEQDWYWMPSTAYANPLQAMDQGIEWGRNAI
ncbi:hypothetical protein [Paenibacillus sp. GCM10027626]|uniref:hypothetical protein n=1 Tax=Paenibacillus sp. GCM10027626 TaxID=3273411 RepID=UPI003629560E